MNADVIDLEFLDKVLLGSMGALSLMTILSVVIGKIFQSVPAQFQTSKLPKASLSSSCYFAHTNKPFSGKYMMRYFSLFEQHYR